MKKLTFVGSGSMAEAMISGMLKSNLIEKNGIWVTNRKDDNKLNRMNRDYGVNTSYNSEELFRNADAVILAMKPKDAAEAITRIKDYLTEDMLIISVLAGISISSIEELSGKSLAIVRAMPNTSAAIGKSATAIAVNKMVTDQQKKIVKQMFETIGLTTFVEEEQLDAVTGLSGSGPAYIYYFVEAMEKSAVEIGLEKEVAKQLIVQTLLGAAEMLTKSSKSPEQLRREVTSPGGTTEAGIKVLEAHNVQHAFISCIKEATAHSKRLGSMLKEAVTVKQ
ncbi:pyrroline-5-carboxylate reductase [Bacillus methanolicus PB1]|uniref:Pyrroline-5-carboxylate reductase n=1 Tax=Bacillus methanolicus PB1 TaxID=997296 RepID=I3DX07_BACMT|nr:pyrroline-5-carboxylate reductase [Bacillus methanolicus]EIJ78778.1 pyrroline-5-carboxylate reductase [Bacillus methanolicus PB1]